MKRKILLGTRFKEEGFRGLETDFELIYPEKEVFTEEEILQKLNDVEVFVPGSGYKVNKEMIDKGEKLQLIANYGVGYDSIDVDYAAQKNITVINTPQSVLQPTAELCFGIMLTAARRIAFYDRKLRTPEGLEWGLYDNPGVGLYGKTLGIFGMGRIGQAVAERAVACGMKIIYHNRHRLDNDIENKYNADYVSFDDLLAKSDFVSLNAPSTNETSKLMGEDEFKKMKPTAIFINTSRGDVVDEKALIYALKKKIILGAALDVYEHEPYISDELKEFENVVLTPHAGTQTLEAKFAMQKELEENIIGFYKGEKISKVN